MKFYNGFVLNQILKIVFHFNSARSVFQQSSKTFCKVFKRFTIFMHFTQHKKITISFQCFSSSLLSESGLYSITNHHAILLQTYANGLYRKNDWSLSSLHKSGDRVLCRRLFVFKNGSEIRMRCGVAVNCNDTDMLGYLWHFR